MPNSSNNANASNAKNNFNFKSGFAEDIVQYIRFKVNCGYKDTSFKYGLKKFDKFCVLRGIDKPVFSREDADAWTKRQKNEKSTVHYKRVNLIKDFLTYELARGRNVFVMRDVRFKKTNFQAHIYTDKETESYFRAVDSANGLSSKDAVQLPVLFRILYCCGTRIGETLSIRKRDVDLEEGVITLKQTKGGKERYIVLGADMKVLMRTYAEKCFHTIADDGLIFTSGRNNRIDHRTIYVLHQKFLREAGIPYLGGGRGPRVHDWRHHFAVYAFKRMSDSGMDMYVSLPILAAYLGHDNILATEQYIRLTMQHFPSIEEKIKDKVKAIFGDMENEDN